MAEVGALRAALSAALRLYIVAHVNSNDCHLYYMVSISSTGLAMSTVIHSILEWLGRTGQGGQGASVPLCHPSDTVLPLHSLDSSQELRHLIMQRTFRFNAVLDADMLRDSWGELLALGDWRKLGGRLRLSVRLSRR